jgi:isopenicillin N synthase-like dioxygenase
MATNSVPILDFAAFNSSDISKKWEFYNALGRAFTEYGFIELVNHPIDPDLLRRAYQLGENFFDLQMSQKSKYTDPHSLGQRGYTSFGLKQPERSSETLREVPEFKEAWQMGRDWTLALSDHSPCNCADPTDCDHKTHSSTHSLPTAPKNYWPVELDLKDVFTQLYDQLELLSLDLLDACSFYLGESDFTLRSLAEKGTSFLRILNYPELSQEFSPDRIRMSEHEDLSLITLLCAPAVEGLQVLKLGEWLPVGRAKNSIIINVGELLCYITRGGFKSAVHRVVRSPQGYPRRLSIPFFLIPDYQKILTPIKFERDHSPERKTDRTTVPVSAGDYMMRRIPELPTY